MTNLHTTIEAAIRSELWDSKTRTMPVSALSSHLATAVLRAVRGAGYEVARDGCGGRMPATARKSAQDVRDGSEA